MGGRPRPFGTLIQCNYCPLPPAHTRGGGGGGSGAARARARRGPEGGREAGAAGPAPARPPRLKEAAAGAAPI